LRVCMCACVRAYIKKKLILVVQIQKIQNTVF